MPKFPALLFAGELVVVELEVDTVPGGPHADCEVKLEVKVGRSGLFAVACGRQLKGWSSRSGSNSRHQPTH